MDLWCSRSRPRAGWHLPYLASLNRAARRRTLNDMERQRDSGFDDLSVEDKILVVQDLWDRIAARPDVVEVTEEQRAELDRRLRAHHANPDQVSTWEEVAARIRSGR